MAELVDIRIEAAGTYYLAASHMAPIRRVAITNLALEAVEAVVTCRVESASASDLLYPVSRRIDMPLVGGDEVWERIAMRPNLRALAMLEERIDGYVVVEVIVDGEVVGIQREPMTFLAANQWLFRPSHYDSLAAFVQPNSPALRPILQRTRELLGERTGATSTEGYQSGTDRVRQLARAAFDAMFEAGIEYSNPPAAFEGYGQKVRTPEMVMAESAATCLDSACLYASVLGAMGLDAMVVLVAGHAFAAFTTDEAAALDPGLNEPVVTDRNLVSSLAANDSLIGVETTSFTQHVDGGYDAAVRRAASHFGDGSDGLNAVVNIGRAIAFGVAPLPTAAVIARRAGESLDQGEIVGSSAVAGGAAWPAPAPTHSSAPHPHPPPPPHPSAVSRPAAPVDRMERFEAPERVVNWMRSLLDLSYSNQLLRLGGSRGDRGVLRLPLPTRALSALEDRLMASKPIYLVPATSAPSSLGRDPDNDELYAAHIATSGQAYFPSVGDAIAQAEALRSVAEEQLAGATAAAVERVVQATLTDDYSATLNRSIGSLRRKAREIENLTGSNNLFLCIGLLEWGDLVNGTIASVEGRAPLILVPVRVQGREATGYSIVIDDAAEPVANYCLIEKLRQTHGLSLDTLETPVTDEHGIDVAALFAEVRDVLSAAKANNARVLEVAHLAVVDFASFRLWRDLRDHWREFVKAPIVSHLVSTPGETFVQEFGDVDGAELVEPLCPVQCDESQLEAVQWAVARRTFVLEGPPGTGKSQTITNLLAASMAAGLKVLFVAEKQPALEVVRRRLDEVGLTASYLDLFDKKAKPESIRSQIRNSLDLDAVDCSSEWSETGDDLEAVDRRLTGYRDALHGTNAVGDSAWSAYDEYLRLGDGPFLTIPPAVLAAGPERLAAAARTFRDVGRIVGDRVRTDHPWSLARCTTLDSVDRAQFSEVLRQLAQCRRSIISAPAPVRSLLESVESPTDLARLATLAERFDAVSPVGTIDASVGTDGWVAGWSQFLARIDRFVASHRELSVVVQPTIYNVDIAPLIALGDAAMSAGLLSRSRSIREFRAGVAPFLVQPHVEVSVEDQSAVLRRVQQVQAEWAALRSAVAQAVQLRGLADWDPLGQGHVDALRAHLELQATTAQVLADPFGQAMAEATLSATPLPDGFSASLRYCTNAWDYIARVLVVDAGSFQRWVGVRSFFEAWAGAESSWLADERLIELQRWSEIAAAIAPLTDVGLHEVAGSVLDGALHLDEATSMFRRGLNRASVSERFDAGGLATIDGRAHDRAAEDYAALQQRRRELMVDRIPAELIQRRPIPGGKRTGKWGELEQELNRKSRRLSLRALFERYGAQISDLTPCFLMGPDSVARFLPPGAVDFDLVVFDEASQIEVPRAIGAMGRAKAAVVVGDTRQMPPSRFGGRSGGSEDETEEPLLVDLESILEECRESNIAALTLKCHYRSRHEGLIAFSNRHFYDDALTTFPSPADEAIPPIGWRRIDGRFRRGRVDSSETDWPLRTNRVEAEAVVAEVLRRIENPVSADESIGVVTLNAPQKDLVISLLEATKHPKVLELLERDDSTSLLVQNLENVQGDERDVILMSVGFAPQFRVGPDGAEVRGRLPLNFGPLNQRGGERRLNVAVTRARAEVVVFCSFDPEEMSVTDSSAVGIQLLCEYLTAARDGAEGRSRGSGRRSPSRHRDAVAEALRCEGYETEADVGLSDFKIDLAVRRPGDRSWKVAVLFDGPGWARRRTVFDRDVMPSSVLKGLMDWPEVVRLWLPAWVFQRDEVLASIAAALGRADVAEAERIARDAARIHVAATPSMEAPSMAAPQLASGAIGGAVGADRTAVTDDEATSVSGHGSDLDRLGDPQVEADLRNELSEIIESLGPIEASECLRTLARRHGLNRVTAARIDQLATLLPIDLVRTSDFGSFVWPRRLDPDTWSLWRGSGELERRSADQIPPEEIVNTFFARLNEGPPVEVEDLLKASSMMLGSSRLTAPYRERLLAVLLYCVEHGLFALNDNVVSMSAAR